jgi:hypothetical protein
MSYHIRVVKAVPELELVEGDVILYDPRNTAEPYTLYRAIPLDPGAILNQLNEETLEWVDIIPPSQRPSARRVDEPRVLPLRRKDQQAG